MIGIITGCRPHPQGWNTQMNVKLAIATVVAIAALAAAGAASASTGPSNQDSTFTPVAGNLLVAEYDDDYDCEWDYDDGEFYCDWEDDEDDEDEDHDDDFDLEVEVEL